MDLIGDLPREIRHLILSLLPYHEAVATSTLSTTWRYDWLYSYSLNFDHTFFKFWESYDERLWNSPDNTYRLGKSKHASVRYLDFLHEVLIRTRIMKYGSFRIRNLELDLSNSCFRYIMSYDINPVLVSFLDNLSKVENLILAISSNQFCDEILPFFSTTKSLNEVQVRNYYSGTQGRRTRTLDGVINPSSCLRKLQLYSTYLDQSRIETLFVNDTNIIESITIDRCCGFKHLKLLGLSKLKELHLSYNWNLERVEIKRAPNLHSLYYSAGYALRSLVLFNNASLTQEKLSYMSKCVIFQLPRIKELELHQCDDILKQDESCMSRLERLRIFGIYGNAMEMDKLRLDYCRNLTHLKLVNCNIVDDWLNRNLLALEKLEVLIIEDCHRLEHVRISLNHLEILRFIKCRKLEIVEMDCPNLSNFKYVPYSACLFSAPRCVIRGSISSPTRIDLYVEEPMWLYHDCKLLALLKKLRDLQYRELSHKSEEGRQCLLRHFEVEHLKVMAACYIITYDQRKLLDELLWLCPHTKKIQFTTLDKYETPQRDPFNVIIRFDHKEPTTLRDKCGFYADHPINCWMHSVKNIVIEERQGFEDDDSVGKFWNSLINRWNEQLSKINSSHCEKSDAMISTQQNNKAASTSAADGNKLRRGTLRWLLGIVAEICSSNQE